MGGRISVPGYRTFVYVYGSEFNGGHRTNVMVLVQYHFFVRVVGQWDQITGVMDNRRWNANPFQEVIVRIDRKNATGKLW